MSLLIYFLSLFILIQWQLTMAFSLFLIFLHNAYGHCLSNTLSLCSWPLFFQILFYLYAYGHCSFKYFIIMLMAIVCYAHGHYSFLYFGHCSFKYLSSLWPLFFEVLVIIMLMAIIFIQVISLSIKQA